MTLLGQKRSETPEKHPAILGAIAKYKAKGNYDLSGDLTFHLNKASYKLKNYPNGDYGLGRHQKFRNNSEIYAERDVKAARKQVIRVDLVKSEQYNAVATEQMIILTWPLAQQRTVDTRRENQRPLALDETKQQHEPHEHVTLRGSCSIKGRK